jgi:hypothetical protein
VGGAIFVVSGLVEAHWRMLTDPCHCCGRYRIEAVMLDRLDGRGPRPLYRLRQNGHVLAEYSTPDALVAELDRRGILIEFPDGCE